jgi:hypothetical protein
LILKTTIWVLAGALATVVALVFASAFVVTDMSNLSFLPLLVLAAAIGGIVGALGARGVLSTKIIAAMVVGLCVCCCGAVLFWLYITGVSSRLAYDLVPQYPGSELVSSSDSGGGSSIQFKQYIYHTTDELDEVVTYMERHLPGFTKEFSEENGLVYINQVQDTSDLARLSTKYSTHSEDPVFPTARIWLYEDKHNEVTVIKVLLEYPTY